MKTPVRAYFDRVYAYQNSIETDRNTNERLGVSVARLFDPEDKQEHLILKLLQQHRQKKAEYGVQAPVASEDVGIKPTHYQLARIAEKLRRAVKVYTYKGIQVGDTFETIMIDIAGHALLAVSQLDEV